MDGKPFLKAANITAGTRVLDIYVAPDETDLDLLVDEVVSQARSAKEDEPFYVLDLDVLVSLMNLWRTVLPRIEPYYAVKVNDHDGILHTLASLGAGFDCASKNEVMKILHLGIDPSRIVYSHPCKHSSHLEYATQNRVNMSVFDSEDELRKIKSSNTSSSMQLLMRIHAADPAALWTVGSKFGCTVIEGQRLVDLAVKLELNLVGISFHVGSGCKSTLAFNDAIAGARQIFDYASFTHNLKLNILDIGEDLLESRTRAKSLKRCAFLFCDPLVVSLEKYFPASDGVRIIAEPGRYFSMTALTLCASIIARRTVPQENDRPMYYISDGTFGSLTYYPLEGEGDSRVISATSASSSEPRSSTVWGPTCNAKDCVFSDIYLPLLEIGDWFVFSDMGAYSLANATVFNGFPKPRVVPVVRRKTVDKLQWNAK